MEYMLYEKAGDHIAHIRLNRPDRLNAFSAPVERDLNESVKQAVADPDVRVVIFSGQGRGFSAGADLKEGVGTEDLAGRSLAERVGQTVWLETVRLLRRPDKIFIAAVHGWAAGQGVELCIASDFVVCTEEARFFFAETRVGFNLASGVSRLLPLLVGLANARRLTLLGQTIDGQEAFRLGLAVKVVPEGQHEAAALELAQEASKGAPLAVAVQKHLLDAALETTLTVAQDAEYQASLLLGQTEDAREAARAFVQKRQPVFQGR